MVTFIPGTWENLRTTHSRQYTCGHCSSNLTSNTGYRSLAGPAETAFIYICHFCNRPTLFFEGLQVPASQLGHAVENLPKDIDDLYCEIRSATGAGSYTAAVLAGRKLLMHIAVELGAKENGTFLEYVDYLVDKHYAPPNSKKWIDKIRTLGNDANHEIVIMGATEANTVVRFLEMLLLLIYEYPSEVEDDDSEAA